MLKVSTDKFIRTIKVPIGTNNWEIETHRNKLEKWVCSLFCVSLVFFLFPDICTNKFFSHRKSRINNCFKESNDHHDFAIFKSGLVSWQLAKRHSLNFALLNLQDFFDRRKKNSDFVILLFKQHWRLAQTRKLPKICQKSQKRPKISFLCTWLSKKVAWFHNSILPLENSLKFWKSKQKCKHRF